VSFPLFEKLEVNGDNTHPLFKYLKQKAPGVFGTEAIKWNFTKFLVNRRGEVVKRFAPKDKPEAIASEVEALL
ncbi:MAG: glutathione peroxidase, partial [Exilibacterium sp.]